MIVMAKIVFLVSLVVLFALAVFFVIGWIAMWFVLVRDAHLESQEDEQAGSPEDQEDGS